MITPREMAVLLSRIEEPLGQFTFQYLPSGTNTWGRWVYSPGITPTYSSACYGKDGETFLWSTYDPVNSRGGIIEIDRNYNTTVLQQESRVRYNSPAYNHETNKLIVCRRDEVANTYSIIQLEGTKKTAEITTVGGKSFGRVEQLVWDQVDKSRFWGADATNHWIFLTDMTGAEHWSFGEYGVSGDDDTHLNKAETLLPKRMGHVDAILVGDYNNHRCLVIRINDKAIVQKLPFGYPWVHEAFLGQTALTMDDRYGGGALGVFIGEWFSPNCMSYFWTSGFNTCDVHPVDPFLMVMDRFEGFVERRMAAYQERVYTAHINLLKNTSASAGVPIYTHPIPDWYRSNKALFVKPTQAGTIDLEIPRFTEQYSFWDGTWETYLSDSLTADKLKAVVSSVPLGIFRMKITLDAAGVLNSWANLAP